MILLQWIRIILYAAMIPPLAIIYLIVQILKLPTPVLVIIFIGLCLLAFFAGLASVGAPYNGY